MKNVNLFFGHALFLWLMFASAQTPPIEGWEKHPSLQTDVWHNGFFISDTKGWVISHQTGLVLQTINGGKNWTVQAKLGEGYLESIYFVDEKHGWICGEQGRIFKTSDSGKTWTSLNFFQKNAALSSVYFFDQKHGFVFGFDITNRKNLIFETQNGGATWLNRSSEITVSGNLTDTSFTLDKKTLFVGGKNFVLRVDKRGERLQVLETKNNGVIRGLFFQNPKVGWAVGHQGLLLKTSDGGETWEAKKPFTANILRSVSFLNEKTGFIAGNTSENGVSLWQTNDGGQTWQEVNKDFSNLHRLILSPKKLWLFGANGAIFSRLR